MKSNYKNRVKKAASLKHTKSDLKLFLLALIRSEGFGEKRLMRVLYEFCELMEETNYNSDEMMIVDSVVEKVLGKDVMKCIGYEPFITKNWEVK